MTEPQLLSHFLRTYYLKLLLSFGDKNKQGYRTVLYISSWGFYNKFMTQGFPSRRPSGAEVLEVFNQNLLECPVIRAVLLMH